MYNDNLITMGMTENGEYLSIIPKMANRHGLIAGATGTGKTVTLKVMAEAFSDAGVPVFLSDVKGDLAGMCENGVDSDNMRSRIEYFKLEDMGFKYKSYPTRFWDLLGQKGIPLRTTVSDFGPILFSRLLNLNQTQSDILTVLFKICDDNNLLLIDMKDLKAALNYCADHAADFKAEYGNIAPQSVAAIMRALVALEEKGGNYFFGEPNLELSDLFKTADDGRGYINVLAADSLINDTTLYSTFLLWLLSELFEKLPEVGDREKPSMVFFFDEAHLLFNNCPSALLEKIEQVVKLIRSKGVGVYFITQNPRDIPDSVLAQLGNKIQHALHAYTPKEQKGIKAAAESFRVNPDLDTITAIQNLGTGEAVVSFLQADGTPSMVQAAKILPPASKMGTIDDNMRSRVIASDEFCNKYTDLVERDSVYEYVQQLNEEEAQAMQEAAEAIAKEKEEAKLAKEKEKAEAKLAKEQERAAVKLAKEEAKAAEKAEKEKAAEKKRLKRKAATVAGSAAGTVGRELGNTLGESLGGSFGKKIGGNVGATLGRGILQTLFKL